MMLLLLLLTMMMMRGQPHHTGGPGSADLQNFDLLGSTRLPPLTPLSSL